MSTSARAEGGDGNGDCSAQSTKSERWKKEHCPPTDSGKPTDTGTSENKGSDGDKHGDKKGDNPSNVHIQPLERRGTSSLGGAATDTSHSSQQIPLKKEFVPSGEADSSGPGEGPGSTDRSEDRKHDQGRGGPVATVPSSSVGPGSTALSFDGLRAVDTRFADEGNQFTVEPPDQGLCVGNGFVVEAVNSVIGVYHSDGTLVSSQSLNKFFGYPSQFNRVTGREGPQPTDPSCLYDPASGKFIVDVVTYFVNAETGAATGANQIDIAVSQTGDPSGGWDLYDFQVADDGTNGTVVHPHCPCLGDYPHVGIDANGYYVTTNEYPWFTDGFNGAQLYAISKGDLTSGAPDTKVLHYDNLTAAGNPGFTVWPGNANPSDYVSTNDGTEYFLSSMAAPEAGNTTGKDNRIAVWSLTNTNRLASGDGAPDLSNSVVETETYALPPQADQKQAPLELLPLLSCLKDTTPLELFGGLSCDQAVAGFTNEHGEPINDPYINDEREGPLDALDSRMQQVWINQGLVIGSMGTAVNVGGQQKAGVAWFAFDPSGAKASLASQGYLAVGDNNLTMPAVATLPDGTGVMAMTLSGADYYPTAAYATVQVSSSGMTVGSVQVAADGVGPQDGFSEYHAFSPFPDGTPRPRWGDYGAAVSDGSSLWIGSEYIGQSCTYMQYLASGLVCPDFSRAALANWYTRISQLTP
jgi:hypothetical protein